MPQGQEMFLKRCEVRLLRLDLPVHRCLVCYSTNIVTFSATEKWAWQKGQIADSLCQIWSLPNIYAEKIKKVSYCGKCYEKALNLNIIYRKIKRLQTKLFDNRVKVEEEMLKSHKIYKAEENKFNIPLPWDDVRKQIISGLTFASTVEFEEEDSEDKAFLAWAEGNNSNEAKTPTVAVAKSKRTARKKGENQQTVNFSEAMTLLNNAPSSPGVLSDSDIFNEMIEPSELTDLEKNLDAIPVENVVPSYDAKENNSMNPRLSNESEEENIFDTDRLSQFASVPIEEDDNTVQVPLVPCTVPGCHKMFKNSILLVGHTKRFHEGIEKPYMCDICGHAFAIYQDLKNHRGSHFSERPLMCQYCGKRFKQWRYLKYHISLHLSGQSYKCKVCDKEFQGPSMLRIHVDTHKSDGGYMCEVCSAVFKSPRQLKYHQLKHETPQRLIVCEFCPGKTFANPRNLRIHMKRHNDDFDVRCPVCNMGLENQTRLKSHMISHSDDMPFICDICSKGFKHKDSLTLHKKRHVMRDNDDRPFQCNICNKRFLAKRYLIRHAVLHDPTNNQYPCKMCDETFPLYHFLQSHVKKFHTSNTTPSVESSQQQNLPSSNNKVKKPTKTKKKDTIVRTTTVINDEVDETIGNKSVPVPVQFLTIEYQDPVSKSITHNQQVQLESLSENINMEGVTLQITLQPQSQVNMGQQQVNLESMVQQVNLEQISQPLGLDSMAHQQVHLEPLVQQVTLDSISQQMNLEPLTQVNLESIAGQINLDSIGQLNLESMRQVNVEPMTRLMEPMTQVNLANMGQISMDSMGQLSRVNVGPMGQVNLEPLTTINIDSIPQMSLETLPQMNMESMSRMNMEPMSQMNLESMSTINMESMNQANILPPIDHVHLDSIGQQDMDNDDSNYFESVSIDENDSDEMVQQNVNTGPSSCMFEVMDMGVIGMEMGGPMEMEASPATTLMETLASYYPDI